MDGTAWSRAKRKVSCRHASEDEAKKSTQKMTGCSAHLYGQECHVLVSLIDIHTETVRVDALFERLVSGQPVEAHRTLERGVSIQLAR